MYSTSKLPDFYSVRNYEQIDYSFEGLDDKKCLVFFDNGFVSNVIESNKRDIRFIWDGFLLFVDRDVSIEDIRGEIDLYDSRLVALQRSSVLGEKFNNIEVRSYILNKLQERDIPIEFMDDYQEVDGYPSKCDLWSTRDRAVLMDAIDTTGNGDAYYFSSSSFNFNITFNTSMIPNFCYQHSGAIVLKGVNSTAIARLLLNESGLKKQVEEVIGQEKLYSILEGRDISGVDIAKMMKVK